MEADIKALPDFKERKHFICIGNFLHEPNWNAVLYLKEEIWPFISKQLPEAELLIYGAYSSQKVTALHNPKQRFFIKGRAEDAKHVVSNARVCLAPLRFGAGLKGKLVEAMQCCTPSVTTNIGAEGMQGNIKWNGIIANTPQEIAEAAVKLFTDKELWLQSQTNGIEIINTRFQKAILGEAFINHVLAVQQDLGKYRLNNFMGAMLMQHTTASTKYMSKWIEEKNKN
jgi:glycosyltransferase involved in cell wall biosynthesis